MFSPMKYRILIVLFITLSLFHISTCILPGQPSRLSVKSVTETLQKGKVLRTTADIYFDTGSGRIINMTHSPEEYVSIVTPEGKTDVYYPSGNSRVSMQNLALSSRNNNLWFFLNNEGYDMGLQSMGFKIDGIRQEENYTVTTWQAPLRALAEVDKIDLVHENHLPVYLEYRDTKGKTTLKVYYEEYLRIGQWMLPGRVTEIIFTNQKDSVIRRSTYSDFRYGNDADPKGFDFTIPPDAVLLK
jgi:outer membrane lipoprotein-sorting protein